MEASLDKFHRFDWGVAPASKGDWAFLLHRPSAAPRNNTPWGATAAILPFTERLAIMCSRNAQEVNGSSVAMAKMNMYIHEIRDAKIGWGDTLANPVFLDADGNLLSYTHKRHQ